MADGGHDRVGGEAAEGAEGAVLHRVAEVGEEGEGGGVAVAMRSMVSTPRTAPMRQGVHLPQDSVAQNSMETGHAEHVSAVVEDHDPGVADQAALGVVFLIPEGGVEFRRGK